MPRKPPSSSRRGTLALASLLAISLLLVVCFSTSAQGRPVGPPHGRRHEEQSRDDAPQPQAASDAAASPSPSAPPTLALLLAPAPAPSSSTAAAGGILQETGVKGAAAAPSPSASASAVSDAGEDDDAEDEEEEASSDDGAGDAAPGSEEEEDPKTEAGVLDEVAGAYRAPSAAAESPAVPGLPKKVKFLARGASKEIDQSEVDPSSLSGEKGSFVFYGRYCGPG